MNGDEQPELNSIWYEAKGQIEQGNYDKAVQIYKYVLIRYGDYPAAVEYANAYLGDLFLTTQRVSLAEKHLKKAIALAPGTAHYHYLLGFAYSKREVWGKAIREFNKALRLEPDNGEYERGLGWAVLNDGDTLKGLTHLYRAAELLPHDINVMMDLGTAMLMLGNLDKAREYAEKTLRLDPGSAVGRRLLETVKDVEKKRKRSWPG